MALTVSGRSFASSSRRGGNAKNERRLGLLMVLPFFILFLAVMIIPVGYALYLSFFTEQSSGLGFGGTEQLFAGIDNYLAVLKDPVFRSGFGHVALYALAAFPISMAAAVGLALLLDAGLAWGRKIIQTTLFIPHAVPALIATIVWIYLYTPAISPIYDLLNTLGAKVDFFGMPQAYFSMANIAWWGGIGYNVIIFYAALQAIEKEVIEAATMDGAGGFRLALSIKFPYLRSTIVFLVLFGAVGMMQVFTEPQLLSTYAPDVSSTWSPAMYIYNKAFVATDFGMAAAGSIVLAIFGGGLSYVITRLGNRWKAS